MLPDPSDISSDGGIEERSTYSSLMDNHSPDGPEVWIYETPESDWTDNGYGTDDDLSELEGDKLKESLMRQKELEDQSRKMIRPKMHSIPSCDISSPKNGRTLSQIDI